MLDWDLVRERIEDAKGIGFDTCHKIYVLMDDEQMVAMKSYGYGDENDPDSLISANEMSAADMFATVKKWYADSCALRFVQAVSTTPEGVDANEGFESLIGQGDSEYDECSNCGEEDCDGWDCQKDLCERCGDDDIYDDYLCRLCWEDDQEEDED